MARRPLSQMSKWTHSFYRFSSASNYLSKTIVTGSRQPAAAARCGGAQSCLFTTPCAYTYMSNAIPIAALGLTALASGDCDQPASAYASRGAWGVQDQQC